MIKAINHKSRFDPNFFNPLRTGLVNSLKELDQYRWSGHSAIINGPEKTWQNIEYVYGLFSDKEKQARKKYREFVEKGMSIGKRPELTGGGLLRSSGGWFALKGFREAGIRVKGDERILGDSDFVETVLKSAKEAFEQKYDFKIKGIDFGYLVKRVAEVMEIHPDVITAFGKSPQTVQARSLLCFWAHRKLGMSTIEIAKRLEISQPTVSRSSRRGEVIEKENRYELVTPNA